MKLLSVYDVMDVTGLNYRNALLLVKAATHLQLGCRYFVSETTLKSFLNPDTPMLIEEEPK